jgi:adenosylcobinamide-GDP ribazoletransferase
MKDFFFALRSCFGFLSTIPVGISMEGIEALMRHIYLFPIGGAVIGFIAGGIGYASSLFLPSAITAFIALISLYYLTGINHLDGLADVGDGISVHGDAERKIAAMKDVSIGSGGVTFVALTLIGTYTALLSIAQVNPLNILPALVIGEVCAKHAMLTASLKAKKIHEGFGSITINNTTVVKYLISLAITFTISIPLYNIKAVAAIVISTLAALGIRATANKHFGGVNGDVVGAANEVARIAALITLSGVIPWTLS